MKLKITRHSDRLWRYKWELTDGKQFIANNYTVTIWGARYAARRELAKYNRPKPKNVGETVFEEEI